MTKYNEGQVTIIFIFLIAVIATFILAVGQSRILLAIQRGNSAKDILIANYEAESKINDVALLTTRGANVPNGTTTTSDGTTIEVNSTIVSNTQTVRVVASRPFATSGIEATRNFQNGGNSDSVDLILSLDCTGSMTFTGGSSSGLSKMHELRNATLAFIDAIENSSNPNAFHVGVEVFGIDSAWLQDSSGRDITPGSVNLQGVRQAIVDGFPLVTINGVQTVTSENSHACDNRPGGGSLRSGTSLGTGFSAPIDYFTTNIRNRVKQVEIVVTDGVPNSSIPHSGCSSTYCPVEDFLCRPQYKRPEWTCSNSGDPVCLQPSLDFLSCATATTQQGGIRNPDIDPYGIIIGERFSNEAQAYTQVQQIFARNIPPNHFYESPDAAQLTSILQAILGQIGTGVSSITINRIVP